MNNISISRRLLLSKTFLNTARSALQRQYDENALAVAVVTMHDAVDNMLGAIASHKGIRLKPKSFMMDAFDAINTHTALTHRIEVDRLNTLRNGIKHQGLVPNPADTAALLATITDFCETTCKIIFSLPLSKVSRKGLIRDEGARNDIDKIELNITTGNYKQAMLETATTMFKHFTYQEWIDARLASAISNTKESKFEVMFPKSQTIDTQVRLLEIGIDPYLYSRFKNLTPDVGYENDKGEAIVFRKDGETWHEDNWTEENALFCMNLLMDVLIGHQREYGGYTIKRRKISHKIRFVKNSHILDYMQRPIKAITTGTEIEAMLLYYADGEVQPSSYSEHECTMVIIKLEDRYDTFLLKSSDFEVVEEKFTQREVAF